MASFGYNMYRAPRRPGWTSSIYRKSSTSNYNSARLAVHVNLTAVPIVFESIWRDVQARETGICPIREELYAQTFDELIRQVTINCAERGLLLLRVRDEMRMTIAAYQVRAG